MNNSNTYIITLHILYEPRIIWWKENQTWSKIFDNDFIVDTNSHHQWQSNQQTKTRSNHWILFFDNFCLLKDSMKRPLHLKFWVALLGLLLMNNVSFSFHYCNLQHAKYTCFKSLRQYYVHAMSWPNVLEHYPCP